jgi:type IV pilus biogenesis protein PilP
MKKNYALACLVAVLASAGAHAESASRAAQQPTGTVAKSDADDPWAKLDALKSENALLNEQLKNVELKKRIAADLASLPGQAPGGTMVANGAPARSTVVEMVSNSPKVNDGKLSALLQLANGGQLTVTVGSRVPELGRITAISIHEVLADAGGHIVSIPFALDQGTDMATGQAGAR